MLNSNPHSLNVKLLSQFPEFKLFYSFKSNKVEHDNCTQNDAQAKTSEELLEIAFQELKKELIINLLEIVKRCSSKFFEQLVVDLMVKMGYGGSYQEASRAIGRSGDEGIDGVINEDRLGLEVR